jgi:hypothetical protein
MVTRFSFHPWIVAAFFVPWVFWSAHSADAGMSLGTGQNLSWSPSSNPSPVLTIPVLNDLSTSQQMAAWALGLQIFRTSGSGTLSIDTSSIGTPSNYVFAGSTPNPIQSSQTGGQVFINGDDNFNSVAVPASGKNLVQFSFTSTGANGTFDVRAFNDNAGNITNWTDDAFTNNAFTNAPFNTTTMPTLGTITVAPAATPEPGSLALAAISGLGLLAHGWRARCRAKASGVALQSAADSA